MKLVTSLTSFGLVGVINTGAAYLAFQGAVALGLHYLPSAALSWGAGIVTSYVLNRRFTFRPTADPSAAEGARFLAVYLAQLCLGFADYAVLIGRLRMPATPAFVINTLLSAVFSYAFMRWVVFRAGPSSLAH